MDSTVDVAMPAPRVDALADVEVTHRHALGVAVRRLLKVHGQAMVQHAAVATTHEVPMAHAVNGEAHVLLAQPLAV